MVSIGGKGAVITERSAHVKSTDSFVVLLPPNVDTVAKVLDGDEHDLVVVVPPVICNVNGRVI